MGKSPTVRESTGAAGNRGKGRRKGVPNKATVAGREMMRALADDPAAFAHYQRLYRRGTLHPALVRTIWAYAWGLPAQQIDVKGALSLQTIVEHIHRPLPERQD